MKSAKQRKTAAGKGVYMEVKINPVSYTHLDVYKRQFQYRAGYNFNQYDRRRIFLGAADNLAAGDGRYH